MGKSIDMYIYLYEYASQHAPQIPTGSNKNPNLTSSVLTSKSSLTPGPHAAVPTPATLASSLNSVASSSSTKSQGCLASCTFSSPYRLALQENSPPPSSTPPVTLNPPPPCASVTATHLVPILFPSSCGTS